MSTPSATRKKTKENGATPAPETPQPPRRAILDFDRMLAEHDDDEVGYEIPLTDPRGDPCFNPDGSRSVAIRYGETSDSARRATVLNQITRSEQRRDKDGKPRELTQEERAELFEEQLREKYIATTRSIDLWKKGPDGSYVRIETTPDVVRKAFEVYPHFVDLYWLAEVERANTFRQRATGADQAGDVAGANGPPGEQANDPSAVRAEADHEAHDG